MNWIWVLAGILMLAAVFFALRPTGRREPAKRPEATTMLLREEQLDVRKTREQLADVTAHKEVVREVKTVAVPVAREDLVVEKDGIEAARIPLCEEQVDIATRTVPLNEVNVQRREWEETKQVQAVLRKEVARVETTGDVKVTEETTGE